jgi:flagellar basal-body rod modification protein FlgD
MSISPTGSAFVGGVATGSTGQEVSKDAFLNLLVLQLKNQDPLNPLDNEAMLAQLAQFSTLEEMQKMNASALAQVAMTESLNNAIATTLVGKDAKAVGDAIAYDGEHPVTLEYQLFVQGDARVEVLDENGAVIRTLEPEDGSPGFGNVEWDGRNDQNQEVAAGTYRFRVTQRQEDGTEISGSTFVSGRITGVRFIDGITYLLLGDRRVRLSDVLEINAPADDAVPTPSQSE